MQVQTAAIMPRGPTELSSWACPPLAGQRLRRRITVLLRSYVVILSTPRRAKNLSSLLLGRVNAHK